MPTASGGLDGQDQVGMPTTQQRRQQAAALPSPLRAVNPGVNTMGPPPPVQPQAARLQGRGRATPVPSPASTPPEDSTTRAPPAAPSPHDLVEDGIPGIVEASGGGSSDCDDRVRVLCRFRLCLDELDGAGVDGGDRQNYLSRSGIDDWLHFDEPSALEEECGGPETVSVRMGSAWSRRVFDKVFKPGTGQAEVYRAVELVAHGVAQGFNGTIFAYGQTGSGKTYTMGGASDTSPRPWSSSFSLANPPDYTSGIGSTTPADHVDANTCGEMGGGTSDASGGGLGSEAGVIPRAVSTVLADANARKEQGWEFVLTATYVEIYNERIRDLLDPTNDNLKVYEHPARGVEAAGALEVRVTTLEEAIAVLRIGATHRMTAATLMNQASSRSHSIFTLRLDQRDVVRDCKVSGRLTLVDLAGSERAGKTGAEGRRLEEANSINVSLHTLGRVIRALSESAPHVPFRDSKLTRLLQESLGGNSRTVLIVCCSPEEAQAPETFSTLKFGECAKRVSTFASANVVAAPNEVAAQLSELRAEVVRLKRQLHAAHLREARRLECTPSAAGGRSRRSSAIRAGLASPGDAVLPSPTGARAPRSSSRVEGAFGGSGPLRHRRWSAATPLSRTVSFNASLTARSLGASSDDESWNGVTPHEWERDATVAWSATGSAAEGPSPSAADAGMPTRWRSRLEPPGSLVVDVLTPTVSPDATPVSMARMNSNVDEGGGRGTGVARARESSGAATPLQWPSEERTSRRQLWFDSGRQEPQRRLQHRGDESVARTPAVPAMKGQRTLPQQTSIFLDAAAQQRRQADDNGNDDDDDDDGHDHEEGRNSSRLELSTRASATKAASAAGLAAAATERMTLDRGGGEEKEKELGTIDGESTDEGREEEAAVEMRRLQARVELLEHSRKERETLYEKLLQLKDLRIQSLTSIYQNGSSTFRQAVNTKSKIRHNNNLATSPSTRRAESSTTTATTIKGKLKTNTPRRRKQSTSSSYSDRKETHTARTDAPDNDDCHSLLLGGIENRVVGGDDEVLSSRNGRIGGSGAKRLSRKKRTGAEVRGEMRSPSPGMFQWPPPAPPSSPFERDMGRGSDRGDGNEGSLMSQDDGKVLSDIDDSNRWWDVVERGR